MKRQSLESVNNLITSGQYFDSQTCSINNDECFRDCSCNSHDDEKSPLMVSSDNLRPKKKQSRMANIRDAILESNPEKDLILHESDHEIVVRRPLSYGSMRHHDLDSSIANSLSSAYDSNVGVINCGTLEDDDSDSQKIRHKYYSRLDQREDGKFAMPPHVLPAECYNVITVEDLESKKQSSLVTIFSIWSTMMGTSILSMPWAIEKSGFACGIILLVLMAALCLYTAHLIVKAKTYIGVPGSLELDFTDICKYYMGRFGEWASVLTSLLSLICASIVYWILLSNFLYNDVDFVYDKITNKFNSTNPLENETAYEDVVCIINHNKQYQNDSAHLTNRFHWAPLSDPSHIPTLGLHGDDLYSKIWNLMTVPLILVLVIFPLLNFKSPTFFTKTSAFGSLSVMFIVIFCLRKAFKWGIHLNFHDTDALPAIPLFKWSFPTMSGMLSLAYFIHNCILSILRNQKKPENNGRDLTIAFSCVMATMMFIGITFFITFPLDKSCLSDNLLNNLVPGDNWAFMLRVVLFVQLTLVFPMIAYVFRVQVLKSVFGSIYPGFKHVLVFNIVLVGICISMAIFFPHIGSIIRYCGSMCGFGFVFTLPCVVLILRLKEHGQLNPIIIVIHAFIIALAAANCISQFFI